MEWYHCGRCGSLFESPPGDPDERFCARCGKDPSLGTGLPESQPSPISQAAAPQDADDEASHESRQSRRSRTRNLVTMLVGGWIALLVVVVIGVKALWPEDRDELPETSSVADQFKGTSSDEAVIKLKQALPACAATLQGFVNSGSMEERNQFVADPVNTALRMARFYATSAPPRIDPKTLENTENSLLDVPGRKAIETRWQTPDGLQLDAVFYQKGDTWLLDWDHFARYQEYPWALFAIGEGPDEAEFRLLARLRLSRESTRSSVLKLVFSQPRFGRPQETGITPVNLEILRASPDGQLLDEGFEQLKAGIQPFGSTLESPEAEGMLRVRVRLRRSKSDDDAIGKWRFELVKVIACHWLSSDDPGVKVTPKAK